MRAEFGHWEGDTVELVLGQCYLVTMVERSTRFLAVALVQNKKSETVRNAILSIFRHFPQAVKSITLDNGVEFADHKTIASCLNAPVYFAHPHSPWERGLMIFFGAFLAKWPTAIVSLKAAPCSIFLRKRRPFTPHHISQIADKNLTQDLENAWALHPLLHGSFLS